MSYCIYLRKSRADKELEEQGTMETLARHEKTLLDLAKKMNLNITEIYREVVSGETLAARPQMQQLLSEVENGLWEGVLVMEVERLARGNTIDQGIVSQAFKLSNTLIVTPTKVYNPANEFDEEYFEFGLFMSRREYKTINRRLSAGRLASCKEGNFVGSIPPYGFSKEKTKGEKGFKLVPIDEEIEIVKLIYKLYLSNEDKTGFQGIANRLTDSNIPTRNGKPWTSTHIKSILTNDVYIGKIHWQKTPEMKKSKDGNIIKIRYSNPDCKIFDGKHDKIIDIETFNNVQNIINGRKKSPNNSLAKLQNPFAGVLVCGVCGKTLKRRPVDKRRPGHSPSFDCTTRGCPTVGTPTDIVENKIIDGIKQWLENYKLKEEGNARGHLKRVPNDAVIKSCNKKLEELHEQLNKTYTLVEQGIYDKETFLNRQSFLKSEITETTATISRLKKEDEIAKLKEEYTQDFIPQLENLLNTYNTLPNAQAKNILIKKLFHKIKYTKTTKGNRWSPQKVDDFQLEFISKLPTL